jgi:hypothetical protein
MQRTSDDRCAGQPNALQKKRSLTAMAAAASNSSSFLPRQGSSVDSTTVASIAIVN